MCQSNDKRMHQKSVKCFRVYKKNADGIASFYNNYQLPQIGVATAASAQQFHALRSRKDIKNWANAQAYYRNRDGIHFVVFECTLSKRLKSGLWSDDKDNATKTCTGDVLTVVREVGNGHFRRDDFELNLTA